MKRTAATVVQILFITLVVFAVAGDLDTTFDTDGRVVTAVGAGSDAGYAVAIQPTDGKIVVVGSSQNGTDSDFVVLRYNTNGSLDSSFDGDGIVTTNFEEIMFSEDVAGGVAIDSDGKIVVVGSAQDGFGFSDFAIARYNTDGSLDTSFDGDGRALVKMSDLSDAASSVAIDSAGRIVIAGSALNTTLFVSQLGVARLNSDGSPDTSFDSDGKATTSIGSAGDTGAAMVLDSSDRIIVAGSTSDGSNLDFVVVRYTVSGSPDTSFDTDGIATTPIGSTTDRATAVGIDSNGRIVAAGYTLNASNNYDVGIVRYAADGSLDTTFDTDGKVSQDLSDQDDDFGRGLAIQADNKLVVVGEAEVNNSFISDWVVAKFNSDGSLDTGFGVDGLVVTDFGPNADIANAATLQSDNKIVVAGSTAMSTNDIAVARYENSGVGCVYTLSSISKDVIPQAGIHNFDITTSTGCPWTAESSAGWLQVQMPTSGTGSATITYHVDANMGPLRTATVSIAGQTHTVNQLGVASQLQSARFDFDGDGKTDVSVFRPNPAALPGKVTPEGSTSQWWIFNSGSQTPLGSTFGSPDDLLVPADFTGDGKTDIAFYRPSTAFWYVLRSEDATFYAFPFGGSGDIPAPGDFDGDGKADPAVYRPSSGTWFIFRSSDSGVSAIPFGIAEDKPVVSDYDGDGMDDVAVYRPSANQWWLLRSSAGVLGVQFGDPGDRSAIGDWTGDGRSDLAFYRPSTSQFFVLRSEDMTFFAFPWGAAGDIPASGDYDGDGVMDAAIFRPSTGTWFINRSTDGFLAIPFGLTNDVPIPSSFNVE